MGRTFYSFTGMVYERKSFFKRLFCLHFWNESGVPDDLVFMTGEFWYWCSRCGKEKLFREPPINFGNYPLTTRSKIFITLDTILFFTGERGNHVSQGE